MSGDEALNLEEDNKETVDLCKTSKHYLMVDRLTELPDEILVKILCLLTMKEAAQTTILSRRWIDLWKYTTCLEFDKMHKLRGEWILSTVDFQLGWLRTNDVFAQKKKKKKKGANDVIDRLEQGKIAAWDILRQKRLNYVKWVDGILDSHKSPTISNFRAHFDLDVTFKDHIDRWVEFSIGKQVQMLDLNLKERAGRKDSYPFPVEILYHPNISLVRSLSLNYVELSNETLDMLVSKIPCVESLSVSNTRFLIGTYDFIAPPKLTHLEISECENLIILQVNAFDLKSFTFSGKKSSRLILETTPNLVDVSFGGGFSQRTRRVLPENPEINHFCHQLQSLTIKIPELAVGRFPNIPTLGNLKQLELVLLTTEQSCHFNCSSMIQACPALHKFVLEFDWWSSVKKDQEIKRRECLLPNSLKEVELRKFRGGTADVAMAYFLFENAQSLEKICIDTRNPGMVDYTLLDQTLLEAKKCGAQLAKELCPNVELLII